MTYIGPADPSAAVIAASRCGHAPSWPRRDRQRAAQHGLPVATREPYGLRLRRRGPALQRGYAEPDREFLGLPGERTTTSRHPGSFRYGDGSLYPEDEPGRVAAWNRLLRAVAAAHPGTRLLDLNRELCPDGVFTWTVDGVQVRSDGVHLTPDGVRWLTPWLVRELSRAAR